jgi:DNA-binding response OmpR family regulator
MKNSISDAQGGQRPRNKHQKKSGKKLRILLAEDDREMCRLVSLVLRKDGHEVTMCANGINLLSHLSSYVTGVDRERFDLVISDIRMPGLTGMEVLEVLKYTPTPPPVILITAFGDAETHEAAQRLGAVTLLDKPFDMGKLIDLVDSVLQRSQAVPGGAQ